MDAMCDGQGDGELRDAEQFVWEYRSIGDGSGD